MEPSALASDKHPLLITQLMGASCPSGVWQERTMPKDGGVCSYQPRLFLCLCLCPPVPSLWGPSPIPVPLTARSDTEEQSHRCTPARRHVREWLLPGGWTGAEHHEWQLDTLKSHINANTLTISAPGVYFPVNMQKCWG